MSNIVRLQPDMPAAVLDEEEVTIARLASVLEAAVLDYEIDDDGDLYVKDGLEFPTWVQLIEDKKLVEFFTCFASTGSEGGHVTNSDWMVQVNEMNITNVGVQFYLSGKTVWGHYWMSYDGGFNVRQFIKMLRRFSGAFRAGIRFLRDDGPVLPFGASPR